MSSHRADVAASARAFLAASMIATASLAWCAEATGFRGYLAAIEASGSRVENEAGEKAVFGLLRSELAKAGLLFRESGFADVAGGYSRSSILEASIQGRIPDELVLIVPVNSWIDADRLYDGAYGIASVLDAAVRIAERSKADGPPPISLRFVFLGAERRGKRSGGEAASLGTRTWIRDMDRAAPLAVLYLSVDGPTGVLTARNAGRGILSPYWYYEAVRRSLDASGVVYDLEANRMQIFRLGLADEYGPAAPYLEAGIPAIELRGGAYSDDSFHDLWLVSFIDEFSRIESAGFSESWDRHYFIFQLGGITAVVRETPYAVFLITFAFVVAISILAVSVTRRQAAKMLLRRTPVVIGELLVLYLALVASFLAGSGASALVAQLLGSADAWRLEPHWAVSARFISSFLLFLALLSISVEQRLLTPNPYFYEFAAMTVLAIDILIFAAVDLSVSFYFVWAFIFVEASLAIRKKWATLVAYLAMYAPLSVLIIQLLSKPEMRAFEKIVVPDFLGVILLSALLLPFFVFTASPLLFFAKPGAAARRRAALGFTILALAAELSAAIGAATAPIVTGGVREDLVGREWIDQNGRTFEATMKGKRRMTSGLVYRGGEPVAYKAQRDELRIGGEDHVERVSLVGERSSFLGRQRQRLEVGFRDRPYEVKLTLESRGLFIYDCSLPYEISLDGMRTTIFAGVNPGPSVSFTLTVPEDFEARLIVEAGYLWPLEPYSLPTGEAPADFETIVRASFDLAGWNQ